MINIFAFYSVNVSPVPTCRPPNVVVKRVSGLLCIVTIT